MPRWIPLPCPLPLGPRSVPENLSILRRISFVDISVRSRLVLTIEKCIEIVIIHFTQFEEVLAGLWAGVDFEVNNYIPERSFQEDGHRLGSQTIVAGRR
jgi:hypothetical protein